MLFLLLLARSFPGESLIACILFSETIGYIYTLYIIFEIRIYLFEYLIKSSIFYHEIHGNLQISIGFLWISYWYIVKFSDALLILKRAI